MTGLPSRNALRFSTAISISRCLLSQLWHTMNIDSYACETAIQSNAEHGQLIESLEKRDVEASYEAITLHIIRSYDSIKEHQHRDL